MNPGHDLTNDSVHVWAANLDLPAAKISSLNQTLSRDEHARAERFVSERDQNRFIAGRGLLRPCSRLLLLGRCGRGRLSRGRLLRSRRGRLGFIGAGTGEDAFQRVVSLVTGIFVDPALRR